MKYTVDQLRTPMRHSVSRYLLMGGLLGLATAWIPPSLHYAEAILTFPPPLVIAKEPPQESTATPEPSKENQKGCEWATELLTSREAVDAVCKKVERSESETRAATLRAACLLSERQRMTVETLPDGQTLRLTVGAETNSIATTLCEGLVAFLSFNTKNPIQDPEPEALEDIQRELRAEESALAQSLWPSVTLYVPQGGSEVFIDSASYEAKLTQYRSLLRRSFFRETQAASSGPSFVLVEPPSVLYPPVNWTGRVLLGAGFGWLAFLLAKRTKPGSQPSDESWRST